MNLITTKGFDSSETIAKKIYKEFGKKLSSSLIITYRRKFGKISWKILNKGLIK